MRNNVKFVRQRGMSMVGLMVGLLLSGLGVLAGLTLYRDMVHVTAESTYDSSFDGQMASLLLQIQLELQAVGYGLPTNVNALEIPPAAGEQNVYWRLKADGINVECRRFRERSLTEDDKTFRIVELMKTTAGCTDSTTLNMSTIPTANWSVVTELGRFMVRPHVQAYLTANAISGTLLTFTRATVSCTPFGTGDPKPHTAVTLTVPTATYLNNIVAGGGPAGVGVESVNLCLPNT